MRYSHMLFPDYTVVMVGSRISEGLGSASGDIIICGLPCLVLKWGYPEMLKDSRYATVVEMLEKAPETCAPEGSLRYGSRERKRRKNRSY